MAKVKGMLMSNVVICHTVEFEMDDELVATIGAETDNEGWIDRGTDASRLLEKAVHEAAPKIELNCGTYAKGDYEYEDFTIDGKPVHF